jgi:hypothetical protein
MTIKPVDVVAEIQKEYDVKIANWDLISALGEADQVVKKSLGVEGAYEPDLASGYLTRGISDEVVVADANKLGIEVDKQQLSKDEMVELRGKVSEKLNEALAPELAERLRAFAPGASQPKNPRSYGRDLYNKPRD